MDIIEKLKAYDIVLMPSYQKGRLLKELYDYPELLKTKWMTLEGWKENLLYSYDREAIHYIMKNYQVKYEIAHIYLKNLYYIEKSSYQDPNLQFLSSLKETLINQNLLHENPFFQKMMTYKKIGILGYDFLPIFDQKLLEKYQVEKIEWAEFKENRPIPLYHFSTIEEEVDFIANEILVLLESEIPIKAIKLVNVTQEYESLLKRIFAFYHIPLNLKSGKSLASTNMGSYLMDHYTSKKEDMIESLKVHFSLENEEEQQIYQTILNLFQEYVWCQDMLDVKEMIKYDLKNTFIKERPKKDAVDTISLEEAKQDDYVFLVGCNQGVFPVIHKDEDYISDFRKKEVLLDDTKTKNKKEHDKACRLINALTHLTITYKDKTPFNTYYPSSILTDLFVEENDPKKVFHTFHYSKLYDQIKFTKKLDKLVKYGEISPDLGSYYHNYPQISYKTYQNQYQMIDRDLLFHRLKGSLVLSYSTLDSYNRCGFRYYVNRILKCDPYEETFPQYIGNLYHEVLSKAFFESFEFDRAVMEFQEKSTYHCTKKELFFLNKLLGQLKFVIEVIKEHMKTCRLTNVITERKVTIEKEGPIPVTFMGIIDKILYEQVGDQTYAAIIDYKTGFPNIELTNLVYGIDMQLPIYLYLAYHLEELSNMELIGFYLEKIITPELSISRTKTYEEQKRDLLRLTGYTTTDEKAISNLDSEYQNSKVIKGMKVSKNGFYPYTKVLTKKQLQQLYHLTEKKIDETIDQILQANFTINPKVIGNKNVGCEFCPYRDICFYQEDDKVYVKEIKNLDFLGGDEDA